MFVGAVAVLGIIRHTSGLSRQTAESAGSIVADTAELQTDLATGVPQPAVQDAEVHDSDITASPGKSKPARHPIYSVPSFSRCFPDLQETHFASAIKWGVEPVENREAAEKRKNDLVYIGSCPYYKIDPGMTSSIPYLVPHAADVLETIARNYLDSLHVKGIPLHKILVSSVMRTEEDVRKLQRTNTNASSESCHRYGTTFDIPYNRYYTVTPPDENRRTVQNDTLKWVLAEVLRDARQNGICHIKYEVKQGCFHITAR
ncbi:MAG: hypothetical protein K2J00_07270 [Bacteroidaceae bacterium]|nr:hypothetical protein [Bacteroidaceae bacterium]